MSVHVHERPPWHCSVVTQFVTLATCMLCDRRICGSFGSGSEAKRRTSGAEAVSRHVGELASERARGRRPDIPRS
jgi:hypothetical protein